MFLFLYLYLFLLIFFSERLNIKCLLSSKPVVFMTLGPCPALTAITVLRSCFCFFCPVIKRHVVTSRLCVFFGQIYHIIEHVSTYVCLYYG